MSTLKRLLIPALLAAASFVTCFLVILSPAPAADLKGAPVARAEAEAANPTDAWTGFGLGLRAGLAQGSIDAGGPAGLNSTGQIAGGLAFYRHQFGAIVLGVEGGYDRVWGDVHSLGVADYALTGAATIGVLPTNWAMLYAKGEFIRVSASGGHIDGWGLGTGAEMKIRGTPLSIGLEYMHDWMDSPAPGINIAADRVMAVGKWQFNSPFGR